MISNSFTDYMCPICLQILIEPVVMPCEHELCRPCFKKNVEEANFVCPLCRMRISSWARRNTRKGTLVDLKRWEQIQRLFPEKCQKRLRGEDEEDLFGELLIRFQTRFRLSFSLYLSTAEAFYEWKATLNKYINKLLKNVTDKISSFSYSLIWKWWPCII